MGMSSFQRKMLALSLTGLLPVLTYVTTYMFVPLKDFVTPLIVGTGTAVIMVVVSKFVLLKTPWSDMEESKGLLTMILDSTGLNIPFVCTLKAPFLTAKVDGKQVNTVYDRGLVSYIVPPEQGNYSEEEVDGKKYLLIWLPKENYNRALFSMSGKPMLFYNKKLQAFLTKDALNEVESSTIVDHMILYLSHKVDELSSMIRDFARYIVEQTRPKQGLLSNPMIIMAILVIGLIVIALVMGPSILKVIQGPVAQVGSKALNPLSP